MLLRGKAQSIWIRRLLLIIAVGIASRAAHTGFAILDKYLGDALYAAMVYSILVVLWNASPGRAAGGAMVLMTGIELFQLTMVPARMAGSAHMAVRLAARLIGTEFSLWDMLAYVVGIGCTLSIHRRSGESPRRVSGSEMAIRRDRL